MVFSPESSATPLTVDIPRYSQLDVQWGFEPGTERTMCGIISAKTVIDFYFPGGATPTALDILDFISTHHGLRAEGVGHAAEVDLLKHEGLLAWRRNWLAPSDDLSWLVENEGYNDAQVGAIQAQYALEHQQPDGARAALSSIKTALDDYRPVIASVRPGFGGNRADHQIVLTSVSGDDQTITFMDPERLPGANLRTESLERFIENFNFRAIFTQNF
jgi:hypothetical protein